MVLAQRLVVEEAGRHSQKIAWCAWVSAVRRVLRQGLVVLLAALLGTLVVARRRRRWLYLHQRS